MGEMTYTTFRTQFSAADARRDADPYPQATLVFGEESLCKEAVGLILRRVAPGADRSFQCDAVDATVASIPDICERLNTYALLSGGKTVVAMNPNVFAGGAGGTAGVKKVRQAFDEGKLDEAAKRLLRILGSMNLQPEDLNAENRAATIPLIDPSEAAQKWMGTLFDYCLQNGLHIPAAGSSDAELLLLALERGFPAGHRLVVVVDQVDKRSRLYRFFKSDGMVVDCSLPKGDRAADRKEKEALLRRRFSEMIGEAGKRAAAGVFEAIIDRTGFEIRIFTGGIEKLISYVGGRDQIEVKDVHLLLRRTRKDPLYEFTGAVTERNPGKSLAMMQSLLDGDFEPLQLLAAIGNQIRRLLVVREFMDGPGANLWQRGMHFQRFQSLVYSAIQRYDAELLEFVQSCRETVVPAIETETGSGSEKNKTPKFFSFQPDDLLIAKAKRHPYAVYQDMQAAERFSTTELIEIHHALAETDIRMKSTGQNPVRILEMLVLQICPLNVD